MLNILTLIIIIPHHVSSHICPLETVTSFKPAISQTEYHKCLICFTVESLCDAKCCPSSEVNVSTTGVRTLQSIKIRAGIEVATSGAMTPQSIETGSIHLPHGTGFYMGFSLGHLKDYPGATLDFHPYLYGFYIASEFSKLAPALNKVFFGFPFLTFSSIESQHYSIFRACHPCPNCIQIATLRIWSCTEQLKNKARNTPRCDWWKSGHDSKLWYLGIYFQGMEPLFHKKGAQGRSMIGLTYLARIPWSHHQKWPNAKNRWGARCMILFLFQYICI